MLRLADLIQSIAFELGYKYISSTDTDMDSDTTNKPRQKLAKQLINTAYLTTIQRLPREMFKQSKIIVLPAQYTTGTVAVTQNSKTATGTGSTWTVLMQMRQMLVSGHDKLYFLRAYSSATSYAFSKPYGGANATGKTYKIGCWAIPLPSDFMAPLSDTDVINLDNGSFIRLIDRGKFKRAYPRINQTATPTLCCIDGVTDFPERDTGTISATKDNASVTMSVASALTVDDIGKFLWISGDSVKYKITDYNTPTITVSPVVQRATGSTLAYAVSPAPVPLLWFNACSSTALPIEISYAAKPPELWTDDQKVELPMGYEEWFRCYAKWLVISKLGADAQKKQELLADLAAVSRSLPKYLDSVPIPGSYRGDWSDQFTYGDGA